MVASFAKVSISQSFIIPKIQGNKSEKEKKTFELIQTIVEDKRECVDVCRRARKLCGESKKGRKG